MNTRHPPLLAAAWLMLMWCLEARATVPYPNYEAYQAQSYERHAAECFARIGLQASCARLLETAIEFNPNRASSHYALAQYYLRSGDQARALAELVVALRLNPSLHGAVKSMGDIYVAQGKLSLAEEKYRQYVTAVPTDPMGYYNLATIAALKGDAAQAIERLKQAVAHGFTDRELIEKDPGWAGLRQDATLRALLDEKKAPGP